MTTPSRPSRPGSGFDTDEQRKAFFAKLNGGGGGSGGTGGRNGQRSTSSTAPDDIEPIVEKPAKVRKISSGRSRSGSTTYKPTQQPASPPKLIKPTLYQKLKAAQDGFIDGLKGGVETVWNTLSFGAYENLKKATTGHGIYSFGGQEASETAAKVGREALLQAAGIGVLGKLGAAYRATTTGMKLSTGASGVITPAAAAGLGFSASSKIDAYREDNPTLNPYADKALAMASTLASYVGGIGATKLAIGGTVAAFRKIPAGKALSLADRISSLAERADDRLATAGGYLKKSLESLPGGATISKALGALHKAYSGFSGFTGSTLTDLNAIPGGVSRARANLAKAARVAAQGADEAAYLRAEASKAATAASRAAAASKAMDDKLAALTKGSRISPELRGDLLKTADALDKAAKTAKTGMKSTALQIRAIGYRQSAYTGTVNDIVKDSLVKSSAAQQDRAAQKFKEAVSLHKGANQAVEESSRKAAAIASKAKSELYTALSKAAFVAAGIGAKEGYDQAKISGYQKQAEEAANLGQKFTLPTDKPRSTAGTLAAFAIGTTGNPVEKQFRAGIDRYHASQGLYRAQYFAIEDAVKSGRMSESEGEAEKAKLFKPFQQEGKGLWSFAPASTVLASWKIGDMLDKARRSTVSKTTDVHDADTITTEAHPETIRFHDINAPEIDNPSRGTYAEYLGVEAADRMKELIKPGQYVRVVRDSYSKDSGHGPGKDKYGRTLARVETLPAPFDKLLTVPGVGKIIPAKDIGKKLVREGLADIHYRGLSGRTDTMQQYDKVRAAAQAAGEGIWSPKGRANLDWVGKEKTADEIIAKKFKDRTGKEMPPEKVGPVAQLLELGLLTTGNSGIGRSMKRTGDLIIQAYNAIVAGAGALEYNERASRTTPVKLGRNKSIRTEYDEATDRALSGQTTEADSDRFKDPIYRALHGQN